MDKICRNVYNNLRFVSNERNEKYKMKTSKKLLALALAMGMFATVATGCADESWSYKDDQNTLSPGTYIYYMSGGYSYAANKVSNANSSSSSTESVDVLTQTIKDQDDKEINAQDYILRESDLACKNLLNVEKTFAERKLKLTEEEETAAQSNADTAWGYYGKTYEKMGISKDSFYRAEYLFAAKYNAIFQSIYGVGGEKAVPDDDIKDYFVKNYTDYSYLPMNLYTSSQDSSSATGTTSVALSDEEIKKAKNDFDDFAKMINDGKSTFKEVSETFTQEQGLEENPAVSDTQILDKSSLGDELKKAVKDLKDGKATVIQVGKDTTAVLYLVYKGDINEAAKNVFNETQRNKVLSSMKSEEFQKYMDAQAKEYKCEKNEAVINKYQPSMFKQYLSSN